MSHVYLCLLCPFANLAANQQKSAEAFFAEQQSSRGLPKKLATELEAVREFFDAEVEHQQVGCTEMYISFMNTPGEVFIISRACTYVS